VFGTDEPTVSQVAPLPRPSFALRASEGEAGEGSGEGRG